jgi:hypothetical protein
MDQELKQYLDAMESRIDSRSKATEEHMVTLMTSVKESLERQIEGVASRFDAQAIRLDRQAALLQTGARWTNRMIAWAEKVDVALEKRIQEIGDVRRRVDRIEGGAK